MENIVKTDGQPQETFNVNVDALDDIQIDTPVDSSQESNVHTNDENQSQENQEEFEIDEKFKELDPAEARLRTLQSQRDSHKSAYNKLMKDYDERDQVAGLLDQMIEDEGLLMAFISEIKPDLVKSRDIASELKGQLQQEFGEDFKPQLSRDEAERDDPFGQDSKYYMKLDELKQKLKGGDNLQATTVKEYLKKKKELEANEAEKYALERETVKSQYKMSDVELKSVSDWAMALKFADLVKVHRFLRKFPTRNPNLTSVPGDQQGVKSARDKFLDETMPISQVNQGL